MSRKFIVISCVLIFVIAPVGGVILANTVQHQSEQADKPQDEVVKASKSELLAAAITYNDLLPDYQKIPGKIDSIVDYKIMDKWWYIATVRVMYDTTDSKDRGYIDTAMLLSKFNNQPESISVVTSPGQLFPYQNISGGLGVPYDVIDTLNKSIALDKQRMQ